MTTTPHKLLEIAPFVRPARSGWIAASGSESVLRVAVIGADEQEARDEFAREVRAWIPLFEQVAAEKAEPQL